MGVRAACFDLDGTMRRTLGRRHLIPASAVMSPRDVGGQVYADWEAYDKAGVHDDPQPGTIAVMEALYWAGVQNHVVSGSTEAARPQALQWLDTHAPHYYALKLRLPELEGGVQSGVLKARYVLELQAQGVEVIAFWEDWVPAARVITEMTGVPCVVVNPCYDGICTCGDEAAKV